MSIDDLFPYVDATSTWIYSVVVYSTDPGVSRRRPGRSGSPVRDIWRAHHGRSIIPERHRERRLSLKQLIQRFLVLGAGVELLRRHFDDVGEIGLEQHGAVDGHVVVFDEAALVALYAAGRRAVFVDVEGDLGRRLAVDALALGPRCADTYVCVRTLRVELGRYLGNSGQQGLAKMKTEATPDSYVAPDGYITVLKHRGDFPTTPGGRIIMSMVEGSRQIFSRHLDNINILNKWLYSIPERETSAGAPFWRNDFIPAFDAIAFALMLMETRPKLVLEIGSGNSTKFIRSAIQFLNMGTKIVSVDPFPRAEIDTLCDGIIRKPLENAVGDVLGVFSERPLVFFDGSHRVLPNSDVMVFFLEILPALPNGCIYGIHDINLPYDYFTVLAERMYTEQYMLAAYLLGGGDGDTVELPTCYLTATGEFNKALPQDIDFPFRNGESFWLRRGGQWG
jgi:hypothetical protein